MIEKQRIIESTLNNIRVKDVGKNKKRIRKNLSFLFDSYFN